MWGFWSVIFFYLLLRWISYPQFFVENTTIASLGSFNFIKSFYEGRFFQFVTLYSDLAGTSFLPGNNRILKGFLIIIFFIILLCLFYKNSKKKVVIFFIFSLFLFSWPGIFCFYVSRYIYEGLPFYVLAILFLINFYKGKTESFNLKVKKIGLIVLILVTIFNC